MAVRRASCGELTNTLANTDFFSLLEEQKAQDAFFDLVAEKQRQRMSGQRSPGPEIGGFIKPSKGKKKKLKKNGKNGKNGDTENNNDENSDKSSVGASSSRPLPVTPSLCDDSDMPLNKRELASFSWFQGEVRSRKDAEFLLQFFADGTYMVRRSGNSPYALSVKWNQCPGQGYCTHIKITHSEENGYQLCEIDTFETIAELVAFYSQRSEIFHQRFWSDAQHPAPQLVPFQRSLHAAEIEHEEELERQREQEAMARRRRTLDDPDAPPPPLSPTSFSRTTSSSFPFSDSRQASGSSEPPPLPAHHPTASASEPPPLPGNHPRSPMPPPRPASTLSTPPQSRPMSTLSTGSGTKDMYTMPRKKTGPPALPARDGIPEVCVSGPSLQVPELGDDVYEAPSSIDIYEEPLSSRGTSPVPPAAEPCASSPTPFIPVDAPVIPSRPSRRG